MKNHAENEQTFESMDDQLPVIIFLIILSKNGSAIESSLKLINDFFQGDNIQEFEEKIFLHFKVE